MTRPVITIQSLQNHIRQLNQQRANEHARQREQLERLRIVADEIFTTFTKADDHGHTDLADYLYNSYSCLSEIINTLEQEYI